MTFIEEKAGELVLSVAIDKITDYKDKKQWEKLFIDTSEFLLKKVESGDRIIDEIAELLSKEEMKQVAAKMSAESKYALKDKLYEELTRIMLKYEIPENEAEYYISNFINIILHELEKINPNAFQCAFLGEWKKEEEQNLLEIKSQLLTLSTAITNIQDNKVSVYSIDQVEVDLYRQTENPSLNLDFFEIDDEVFKEQFDDCLDNECIYISGQSKEETILCVLNELRRIRPKNITLVVKSVEDWEKLKVANEKDVELGGKILIPWFYAEQIYAIPNNINIFVFGADEYCGGKNPIKLRKRKRNTINQKLIDAGLNYEEAHKLVEDTHGLYVPLKKKIIRGIDNVVPNWVEGNKNIIIPLLLCGKWSESDGDKMIIEELCGITYDQVMDEIMPYMKGENPLFIRFKVHGNTFVHLASTENAWDYLDEFVSVETNLWDKYVDIIRAIITEENPVFSFPVEQQGYANILPGGKPLWSSVLKEGLLRSLIMKAYYKNDFESQLAVDQIIEAVLNDISSIKQWLSIAELFTILCEASPKAVTKRLEKEWQEDTGLKDVFLKAEDRGPFSRNDYTHFIWGIEQFLCQKEYSAWAIRWLFKMNSFREKYPISNSPLETLKTVFCPWYNITVLPQQEKIELIKEAYDKGYDVWKLLYSELPGQNNSIIDATSKPKYRIIDEPVQVTNKDVTFAYNEYLKLCLNHMDYDILKWQKIIEISNHFNDEILERVSDKLLYEIQSMTDMEITCIKEKFRKEIYRNRYYCSSEWAMKEPLIGKLEYIMNELHVQNEIYDYRYLFIGTYEFPLLHPCPYSDDEKREVNEKLINDEILEGIRRFKERNLDIVSLVNICSELEYTTLGIYLFKVYTNNQFDIELFTNIVTQKSNKRIIVDYVRCAYAKNLNNLRIAINVAEKIGVPEDVVIDLLLLEVVDLKNKPLVADEEEKVKEQYWKRFRIGGFVKSSETVHYIIEQLMIYSNFICILEILDECKEFYSSEEILIILEKIKNHEIGVPTQLSSYHIKNLLSVLQTSFLNTKYCERVALLELPFRGMLDISDMKCFLNCLENSPRLLLDIVAIIFRDDDGNTVGENNFDQTQISNVFSLYYNLKFCPARQGAFVDREKLMCWIQDLQEGLDRNNQNRLFGMILGKMLSASPVGQDGYYPAESIREAIEMFGDQHLENEYVASICNSRGVYSPTGGDEERAMAKRYKENAEAIRTKSPKTAKIFDQLCERYLYEADSERESEEYVGI